MRKKSPLDFILYTWDIKHIIISPDESVIIIIFADDFLILTRNISHLRNTIARLVPLVNKKGLKLNIGKTKIIKFRAGGALTPDDVVLIDNIPIEFVNFYKYLGVTFQQSGFAFSKHIADRCRIAIIAIHSISNLQSLSLKTALKLFYIKVFPIVTYCIEQFWPYNSITSFRKIESVKACFLKKVLSLSKFSKSRLVYELANTPFFVAEIREKFKLPETKNYNKFLIERCDKMSEIDFEFYMTAAMKSDIWHQSNFIKRHVFTRYAAHGFHFLVCNNPSFHDANLNCICKYCSSMCGQYHFKRCALKPLSLNQCASQDKN